MNRLYRAVAKRQCAFAVGIATLLIALLSQPAFAQATSATIFGSITDASGAAVPGAQVTATNIDTNFSRSATTGSDGRYQLVFLPIGTYKVEANAAGFRSLNKQAWSWT